MIDQVLLKTPVVDAIIGREPSWIIRSGISLIFIVVTMLFSLTWFIQYPDKLIASVTLHTEQATVQYPARSNGYLEKLMVKDGEPVLQGQVLALLESQLDYSVLQRVNQLLNKYSDFIHIQQLLTEVQLISSGSQLGELQQNYNVFVKNLQEWYRLQQAKTLKHQQQSTTTLIDKYLNLIEELRLKQETLLKQTNIIKSELNQTENLVNKNLLATNELGKIKQLYLTRQSQLNDNKIDIQIYQLKVSELNQQLAAATILHQEKVTFKTSEIVQQRALMLSKIKRWEKVHLIVSQMNGIVSFNQSLKPHQFVRSDEILFSIIPVSDSMEAWMKVSGRGVGKVKPGQHVQIELENYLAAEFGTFQGVVSSISTVPDKQGYLVKLTLPKQLISSYGVALKSQPMLKGVGKIITKPRRLITRFTDKITYALSHIE